jgi:hypothetical protein
MSARAPGLAAPGDPTGALAPPPVVAAGADAPGVSLPLPQAATRRATIMTSAIGNDCRDIPFLQ